MEVYRKIKTEEASDTRNTEVLLPYNIPDQTNTVDNNTVDNGNVATENTAKAHLMKSNSTAGNGNLSKNSK